MNRTETERVMTNYVFDLFLTLTLTFDLIAPIYQYKTNMYSLKPLESGKEQKRSKFKRPGAANRQNANDVIDDGINRGGDVNRLVARKRYAPTKHSFPHIRECLKSTLTISKQFLVQLAITCAIFINLIGSGLNIYELAKSHMDSWARCCGMPGIWKNEMRRNSS